MDLILANDADSGTIANSTFRGGSIEVFGGPWTDDQQHGDGLNGRHVFAWCFCLAFTARCDRPGNQVSQVDPAGREFRLVVLANSGFDNTIENNSFGGGAGQIGDELSYSRKSGAILGINSPEVILAESTYGVVFEGRPAAISGDGLLLVLPNLRTQAFPTFT